ncbi:PREDICTED: uncharacterized protein LOC109338488 [Lupinus angustifolius]|uniref:uncharacterized protein LOC109338488 n=1 Tax=Lupinus angustifolius TaxID=3871 RepID=UPI00092EF9F2|nr:PREDICTED: uncharacterized protein LOC109338488 [Lupinus angustifolius]
MPFTKSTDNTFTAILVYVDDLVRTGKNIDEITKVKQILDITYKIKDLGKLRYFLGLDIARYASSIHLNQRKYVLSLLEESSTLASKTAKTPFEPTTKLQAHEGIPITDPSSYKRLVGKLIYLTISRHDIYYAIQQLNLFMNNPLDNHYKATLRVLHYLKKSPSQGLFFSSTNSLRLSAFSVSDWASCLDSRKSIIGFCILLGSSIISSKTKKQNNINRSSLKAEYRALGSLACELQWLNYILHDLKLPLSTPISVYCDNQSAIYLAYNPVFHERTKLIEIDYHVV